MLKHPFRALTRAAAIAAAAACTIATATAAAAAPPGPTGCDPLTVSARAPTATVPASAVLRHATGNVRIVLRHPTQRTKATLKVTLPNGRRVDAEDSGTYTCTAPGATNVIAFPIRAFAKDAIRRSGRLTVRVELRLINASGKTRTLRRTVVIRRERPRR